MTSNKLLLDEYPLIVLPSLAVAVGLNEAIVLQQVHYWIRHYRVAGDGSHHRDGRWWVYNSVERWREQFPFWGYNTIRRALASLRKPYAPREGDRRVERGPLLFTANYNRAGFDKTIWYAIDYEELERLGERLAQSGQTDGPERANGDGQGGQVDAPELGEPIPETTRDDAEMVTERAAALPLCSIHNVEMQLRSKGGDAWHSHRLGDGTWCKGAPGDQPVTKQRDRKRYISGEYAEYIQH